MGAIPLQRILIADDEPDLLEITRVSLQTLGGYEVATCESGEDFLRLLPTFGPDLVVIDVLMPDMGGLEILREMRRMEGFQSVPVIFLTGLVLDRDLRKLRESDAADVITKPFDPMTLPSRIDAVWKAAHGS